MTKFLRYLLPSLADVIFASILFYLSFTPNTGLLGDGDTGYHIRAGEYILDTFTLPRIDPYSFITPAIPWTVHEWLSEVIMAITYRMSGLSGVVVFYSIILAATFYTVVRVLKTQGISVLPASTATILIFAAELPGTLFICLLSSFIFPLSDSSARLTPPHLNKAKLSFAKITAIIHRMAA